ncbi:MAG TPA: carbohydrate ABC transporter permease [Roseiflexaceae bacterium]|jgi:ABC-type glycerol-3-phosphate transport system permease component|nr:carbohydrate ABC transporter permease [Roseiflexaceae bacterium]
MVMSQLRLTRTHRVALSQAAAFVLLLIFCVPFLAPLVWLVSTALKTPQQVYAYPPIWIPNPVRLQNFVDAWTAAPFTRFFLNTLITTLIPMIGEVFVSAMVAYSFARVRWPGRDMVFALCLGTMLLPSVATFIPVFLEFKALGWVNTFWPFIVPAFFGVPFYIFMFRQFMITLPHELDEAARIDGANTFQIFARIILPLLGPALATVAIFSFMAHWNDFMGPVIYLQKIELKTLTQGLSSFESMMTGTGGSYGMLSSRLHLLMAVSLLIDLPCIIIFLLFQRYFVRDVVMSGLKG